MQRQNTQKSQHNTEAEHSQMIDTIWFQDFYRTK